MSTVGRKVVCLCADHDTQNMLRAFAIDAGFNIATDYDGNPRNADAFDFHVTLVASANEVGLADTQHMIKPVTAQAIGFDVLGVDRRVPVLKLAASDRLSAMRAHFVDTYGIEPTFAEYKPHVSLAYAWDGKPALEDLALPERPLVFNQLKIAVLKPAPAKGLRAKRAPLQRTVAGAHRLYR